jgi:hypothetical protein
VCRYHYNIFVLIGNSTHQWARLKCSRLHYSFNNDNLYHMYDRYLWKRYHAHKCHIFFFGGKRASTGVWAQGLHMNYAPAQIISLYYL